MGFECVTFQVTFVSPDASLVGFLDGYDGVVGSSEATPSSGTYVLENELSTIEMSLGEGRVFIHIALTNPVAVVALLSAFLNAMARESAISIDADCYRGVDAGAFLPLFSEHFVAERSVFERYLGGVGLGAGYKSTMGDARRLFFQAQTNVRSPNGSE